MLTVIFLWFFNISRVFKKTLIPFSQTLMQNFDTWWNLAYFMFEIRSQLVPTTDFEKQHTFRATTGTSVSTYPIYLKWVI